MPAANCAFNEITIDRAEIQQQRLDLQTRVRTNLFPWRGQFSPGLADLLLSTYAPIGGLVLDPFAGVGTTLIEAARMQLPGRGTEINPAAVAMAETVMFIPLHKDLRERTLQGVRRTLDRAIDPNLPLFSKVTATGSANLKRLTQLAQDSTSNQYERNVLTNVLIRVAEVQDDCDADAVYRAFKQHSRIVEELPYAAQEYSVANCDARQLPLADASVDFVLTSPPYINVFNYHQNNRRPMELLGWDLLHVAKSEFGSNRKHRGNRFLTVVQYCLDIQAMFVELRRVMKPAGRAIFVVGRESCIRGVAFQNGLLVSALAELSGFTLNLRQERKFKNKFGAVIYEDLLHLTPNAERHDGKAGALALAIDELKGRLALSLKDDVARDLRDAITAAAQVATSPLYPCRS